MARGFFPGGNGLFEGEAAKNFPFHGTLVLGSNFGCAAKFGRSDATLVVNDEISDPGNKTWPPLRRLLDESEIDLRACFFSNVWPCLHEGTTNTLGALMKNWLANPALMAICSQFLTGTCAAMQPSLIVALGPGPAAFLGTVWPRELGPWQRNSIAAIDALPLASIQLEGVSHKTVCVALVHPCYQHINAKRRKQPYQNAEGEVRLIKEAHELRNRHWLRPTDS